ncbi:hypothetical protein FB565_002957 [Actinoplanes lutulentus]|uniref:Uncharacterized protein n=1 Tax=Actinoplanes lutulentus TaxID=1287878 RepID=A0A327Z1K2_9ACTN|nr:hypothetical protein [Actinoplanes lutulentus]MBB2943244.1 hypothetical protein [Actinoplanes lutulentus]RAK28305.1 hypothetical protein B0I29_12073 [Actinoplanes lutulentus]
MTVPAEPAPPDMPASLAARPRDERRNLPIPPVNIHPALGGSTFARVDFTTINTVSSTELAAARSCSLCAEPMGYWVAFLGRPRTAELMRFTDPPGHPGCMRSALTLCPHIAIARHRRARADRPGAGVIPAGSHGDKPTGWTLGITRQYRIVPAQGFTVYLPAPFRTTQTYLYGPDGHLSDRAAAG